MQCDYNDKYTSIKANIFTIKKTNKKLNRSFPDAGGLHTHKTLQTA